MKMRLLACFALMLLNVYAALGQKLYVKTYGDEKNEPIIFLHGGPGYNCANFEATAASQLADQGFFVIVYDRRGEGRSVDKAAKFTFEETFDDLNGLYKQFKLKKAILMGHSFGGVVAPLFAEQFSKKIKAVVMVGAPISLQESFKTIIRSSKAIYQANHDSLSLGYIDMLEKMDTTTMEYASYCFGNAMRNGFYTPKQRTEEANALYAKLKEAPELMQLAKTMTREAPMGFWKNEHYTTLDLSTTLVSIQAKKVPVYAFYGKEDGLYAAAQVAAVGQLIGEKHLLYLDQCSHNVFIDQQPAFLGKMKEWLLAK